MDYKGKTEEGNFVWLMRGDCLDRMKEIKDSSVDLILTDPPFGTTQNKWDSVINLELMWKELWRVLKPNGAVVLCASQPFTSILVSSQIKYFKTEWVWSKNKGSGHLNAKKMPMKFHETLEVFYKKPPTYNPQMTSGHKEVSYTGNREASSNYGNVVEVEYNSGDKRHPRNILEIPVINNDGTSEEERVHPTQKPIELMEYMVKTYSNEGDVVLDFTKGYGSTIKASNKLGRHAIGIDSGKCDKKNHRYYGRYWTDIVAEELGLNREGVRYK